MIIRHFDQQAKVYETLPIRLRTTQTSFKLLRSSIPKEFVQRTPLLIYITEFLKGDGTVSIVKRERIWKGDLIFTTTDIRYKSRLKRMLQKQFPRGWIYERSDGLGISSLTLSVLLSQNFGIPVGKKKEMVVTKPQNIEEAKMVLRSIIDTEGNIDNYEGRIVVGNQSQQFLESYTKVLEDWFKIKTSKLSPTKGWGEKTLRIGITNDRDLIKIYKIGLFNPTKQKQLKEIYKSLKKYYREKEKIRHEIIQILSLNQKTVREISQEVDLSPFLVRRLLNSKYFRTTGKTWRGKRQVYLWSIKVGF
jgi:hypothetical protein